MVSACRQRHQLLRPHRLHPRLERGQRLDPGHILLEIFAILNIGILIIFEDIRIFGDYFGIRSISELEALLTGIEYRRETIADALSGVALEDHINGMTVEKLTQLIVIGI